MTELELDKKTLAYGPIAKYYDRELLKNDISWYRQVGYRIYELDASKWYTIDDFHSDTHEVFKFPSYYGRNWGAFDDVISEIDSGKIGNILVCVTSFDSWYRRDNNNAQVFLDIMSDQTYSSLINGKKFITLVQSENPRLNVRDVGAKKVNWNWGEWEDKSRGV